MYIYGTSIDSLIEKGWGQFRVSSRDILQESYDLGTTTKLIGELLTNETDPYFLSEKQSSSGQALDAYAQMLLLRDPPQAWLPA